MTTDFDAAFQQFADTLGLAVETVIRKVAVDLWNGIVLRTPVDKGRARASWLIVQGELTFETAEAPADGVTLPKPSLPALDITGNETVYVVNHLVYIEPLENGHSKQAPAGMVAVTVAEVKAELESAYASAIEAA